MVLQVVLGGTPKKPFFNRYFKSKQDFEIGSELLDNLSSACFLKELSNLIDKQNRNELEDAVVKSLFWIGEAQKTIPTHRLGLNYGLVWNAFYLRRGRDNRA